MPIEAGKIMRKLDGSVLALYENQVVRAAIIHLVSPLHFTNKETAM